MKVFEFDPTTGKRGQLICEMPRFHGYSNMKGAKCALPKHGSDTQWSIATRVEDRNSREVTFDRPVCFCLGQFTAGTDTTWEWVAYLPEAQNA